MKKLQISIHEFDANYLAYAFNADPWDDKDAKKPFGSVSPLTVTRLEKGHIEWAHDLKWWGKVGKRQFNLYKKNRKKIWKEKKTHFSYSKKMINLLKKFNSMNLHKLSDKQIADYLNLIYKYDKNITYSGWTFVGIDFCNNLLTDDLNKRLNELISKRKLSKRNADYFSVLTAPLNDTFASKERKQLLKIARKFKTKKLSKKQKQGLLEDHRKKFGWLTFGFNGPEASIKFYEEEIRDLIKSNELEYNLKKIKTEKNHLKKKIRKAKKELKLNREDEYFFDLAKEIIFLKGFRKEVLVCSFYLISKLKEVVAKKHFVSKSLLGFLTRRELRNHLLERIPFNEKELLKRAKLMVVVSNVQGDKVFSGEKARKKFHELVVREKVSRKKNQFNGQIASPGLIKGKVKIVNSVNDMDKLFENEILVSVATQPELVPAMKRAGGIITDQGGMTCHAAIVSRELNKPCVVGVSKVTEYLNDNDLIELDAYHGIIRILKRLKK